VATVALVVVVVVKHQLPPQELGQSVKEIMVETESLAAHLEVVAVEVLMLLVSLVQANPMVELVYHLALLEQL
jgi:hypothetical protein